MKRYIVWLFLILSLLLPAGSVLAAPVLVGPAELVDQTIRVIDTSPAGVYNLGHLPGAVSLTRDAMVNPAGVLPYMLPTREQLAAALGERGVTAATPLVLAGPPAETARLAWTLRVYGHTDLSVLDGGREAWREAGLTLVASPVVPAPAEYAIDPGRIRPDLIAHTNQVQAALGRVDLVDARTPAAWQGQTQESDAARRGRIPGAVNIPMEDHFDCDGRYLPAEELRALYAAHGITGTRPIIVYCHSGMRAAVNWFALHEILGFDQVRLYDASWLGWSQDPTLPSEGDFSWLRVGEKTADRRGERVEMDVAPYVRAGVTYVPLRYLAAMLGVEPGGIGWDGRTVTLRRGADTLRVFIDRAEIELNGQIRPISVQPEIAPPGRVMLPARVVAEALGARVEWEAATQTVHVQLAHRVELPAAGST